MRLALTTLVALMMLLAGSAVFAQALPAEDASRECWPASHIDRVVVQMADGTTRRGSLLCLGTADFTLVEKQRVGRFRLDGVLAIRKAADPVWDGAAKGASVSLLLLVLCAGHCPAEVVVRTAAGYGLLGLAIDAIETHADTIYRPAGGRSAAAGFHVRF